MTCLFKIEFGRASELLDKSTEKVIGEILTTLEAVVPGDRQAEAAKAIIKQALWRNNRDVKTAMESIASKEEK